MDLAHPMGLLVQFAGLAPSSRRCRNRLATPMLGWGPNSSMSSRETVGVGGAHFLHGEAADGHAFHDHPVAVDDLARVLGGRVVRGAGALAGGGVDIDVRSVGPDAQVADVGEKPGGAGGQHIRVGLQHPGVGPVVHVADPPLAGQAGEPGWEHQRRRGRTEPDVLGDFDRLAVPHDHVMPRRADARGRANPSQRRPAIAGILPDKTVTGPERTVPAHGRRARAEPQRAVTPLRP